MVLDAEILAKAAHGQHYPKPIKDTLLISEFKNTVRSEYIAADEAGHQNVLLLTFRHSDPDTFGIYLRSEKYEFTIKMLEKAIEDLNVNITFLSTACFSGGWACAPNINNATITAAGDKNRSRSWAGPIGRACGSMYTTAVGLF